MNLIFQKNLKQRKNRYRNIKKKRSLKLFKKSQELKTQIDIIKHKLMKRSKIN